MNAQRAWVAGVPALIALAQMTAPMPGPGAFMIVAICGENGGRAVPIRLPGKDNPPAGVPCCKMCDSAMRKRGAGLDRCDGEDEPDAA